MLKDDAKFLLSTEFTATHQLSSLSTANAPTSDFSHRVPMDSHPEDFIQVPPEALHRIEENVVAPSRCNTIASVSAGAEGLCKDGMLVISPISISSF